MMSIVHRQREWDVDRGTPTEDSHYQSRRDFLRSAGSAGLAGLGALGLVGCAPTNGQSLEDPLFKSSISPIPGSAFTPGKRNKNYKVDRPVTEESVSATYNNFYEFGLQKGQCWREAQKLKVRPWSISIEGLVEKPTTLDIDDVIRKMPCEERLYRFRCVERWAMVVPWSGFPFRAFLDWVKPLSSAKFVEFVSFYQPDQAIGQKPGGAYRWPYYEGLTMEEAANDMTFVATGLYGHDIPRQHGSPFRMVVPWKYGYKGPKSLVKIRFVDKRPHTFWNDLAAHEYGFYSNINPKKPHPRWSQEFETMIGTSVRHKTVIYNGYGTHVASMYTGEEH